MRSTATGRTPSGKTNERTVVDGVSDGKGALPRQARASSLEADGALFRGSGGRQLLRRLGDCALQGHGRCALKDSRQNCRHFLSPKARLFGESHVARPVVRRRPGGMHTPGARCAGALSMSCCRPGLPAHWTPRMDAEARVRMREELAIMAELDMVVPLWRSRLGRNWL